jgi:hypothetical protein
VASALGVAVEAEVAKSLSAAEAADAEEDKLDGRDKTGDEMPDWPPTNSGAPSWVDQPLAIEADRVPVPNVYPIRVEEPIVRVRGCRP